MVLSYGGTVGWEGGVACGGEMGVDGGREWVERRALGGWGITAGGETVI